MKIRYSLCGLLVWFTLAQAAFQIDSVIVDSVWNSDSSWYDVNEFYRQRTSRDCRISFFPRSADGFAQCSLFLSIDSGRTWNPEPNPMQILSTAAYNVFPCGKKGSMTCRIFGQDRNNVVFKIKGCNSSVKPFALRLISPLGGESFKLFKDSIVVQWIGDPDSIGTPPVPSFTREFSIDSGKIWTTMSYVPGSPFDNDSYYRFAWIGIDTMQYNLATDAAFTKQDFLNKGILIRIVSYPPKSITVHSGYLFFHE